jgi:hypothetical protein
MAFGPLAQQTAQALSSLRGSAGVLVRIVPSLCPADAWHASMGYRGKLAAEAYFWDENEGCVATFTHSPA